ncbi:SDR family NAD(P)-dependent oxidoreductase [Arthrobacter caoxuetaonis]|uniref:SDR family oxidoreductase n=1 Tax=Arthrobacter caoxuetaonis TaxID=2886935 RepID=A0A9X1MG48_9MICC|nr:SDR family oxidoreductase [Arthrobacter caoxuetaonis]MCC3283662.1 SDR family oxidoreductase [Arthrobacter caoxuetaonis]MCC3299196.1 SDR family oxidoreductase [Arthrobacter caoxuetaonis]USQ58480.1 SDR family oxidoreductase [Arthrobacter caoxuetaonis]
MPAETLNVIIHGAGGAIGGAVAQEFARQGAKLYLAGHREPSVHATAEKVRALGAEVHVSGGVDAYSPVEVDAHTNAVADLAGRIDVLLNAVEIPRVQGIPLLEMDADDVVAPAAGWLRTQFLTARSAARYMVPQGSGTILMLSASPARLALAGVGGFSAACAAVEGLTRTLAAETGAAGVRTVCLRPHRIRETIGATPDLPMELEEFTRFLESLTTSGTLPTLCDVARAAVFLAAGGAASMNGTVLNLTGGMSPD